MTSRFMGDITEESEFPNNAAFVSDTHVPAEFNTLITPAGTASTVPHDK